MSYLLLVVEDDDDLRECFVEALSKAGYQVCVAISGREAVRILQGEPTIDLIISDYLMCDGNGLELLEYVRRNSSKAPPFFLMTGQSQISAAQALRLGAQEFIVKPFDFRAVLQSIQKHLQPR